MKSNSDSSSNPNSSNFSNSAANSSSVPITIYRELAAELQATRAMVDSLNSRNQQLSTQNQQLRQEVGRVVQSVASLHKLSEATRAAEANTPPANTPPSVEQFQVNPSAPFSGQRQPTPRPSLEQTAEAEAIAARLRTPDPLLAHLITEEPTRPTKKTTNSQKTRDLGGVGIALTILLVVLMAFGLGFIVVKQLLPSR
ncbi:MAG: hypothetical protein MUF49_17000 [Oculatellaceae cyanobacterium Prado106]|jgi:hypothetical protein|nr:hypothetical protein [Oculatellaceae cyanobacterium Prado106]